MEEKKSIRTDVLVVGGGLAGCMAAFAAIDECDVTLVDKANVRRSGCTASGIDNIKGVIPPDADPEETPENFAKEFSEFTQGIANLRLLEIIAEEIYDRMIFFEKLGIPIRNKSGQLVRSKLGGKHNWVLHIEGANMKPIFDKALRDRGVNIINRAMVTSLLTQGNRVVGAAGIDVRSGDFYVFHSKATVLATGTTARIYKTSTSIPNHSVLFPHNTGDGVAMAYKAGAEVVNLEFVGGIIHPKNFPSGGLGRAIQVGAKVINSLGEDVVEKHSQGRSEQEVFHGNDIVMAVQNENAEGRGPCFLDFTRVPSDKLEDYWVGIENERPILLEYYRQRGIDITREPFEIEPCIVMLGLGGGVLINQDAATSIEGLYAGGDVAGSIGYSAAHGAIVFGWKAGENAAEYASASDWLPINEDEAKKEKNRIFSLLKRGEGISPRSLELKLRSVMSDYVGFVRNATSLTIGIKKLEKLKEEGQRLKAKDMRDLYKALEVQNMILVGELAARAALIRTESRQLHRRSDYPEKDNENWLKQIVIKREDAIGRAKFTGRGI